MKTIGQAVITLSLICIFYISQTNSADDSSAESEVGEDYTNKKKKKEDVTSDGEGEHTETSVVATGTDYVYDYQGTTVKDYEEEVYVEYAGASTDSISQTTRDKNLPPPMRHAYFYPVMWNIVLNISQDVLANMIRMTLQAEKYNEIHRYTVGYRLGMVSIRIMEAYRAMLRMYRNAAQYGLLEKRPTMWSVFDYVVVDSKYNEICDWAEIFERALLERPGEVNRTDIPSRWRILGKQLGLTLSPTTIRTRRQRTKNHRFFNLRMDYVDLEKNPFLDEKNKINIKSNGRNVARIQNKIIQKDNRTEPRRVFNQEAEEAYKRLLRERKFREEHGVFDPKREGIDVDLTYLQK